METVRMFVLTSRQLFLSRKSLAFFQVFFAISATCILSGCNQSADEQQTSSEDAPGKSLQIEEYSPDSEAPLFIATSSSSDDHAGPEFKTANMTRYQKGAEDYNLPASGTPEWDIHQIALLLVEDSRNTSNLQGHKSSLNGISDDTARRIIALATHAIAETHQRPEKELVFNTAVQSLMDARLKLATAGEKESLDAIYEDAVTLAKDRPGSPASIIAAGTVVRLAREMAQASESNSAWTSEYVRQVKLFATNFPKEEAKAIIQLTTAGEFCERQQLILPAIECYTMIQQQFPQSPFRQKSEAALQRLGLIGKTIALDGPTIDGKTFRLSEKKGRPVILVFWSMRSEAFEQDIELLNQLVTQNNYHLVGINLDTDGAAVRQFIETRNLAGEHIFYTDYSHQGASQPLARQFGINVVPTYWLADKQGRILATNASREQLQSLTGK